VDHGGVVGGQVFSGVRVDPLPAGFADVVRQGEDSPQGWAPNQAVYWSAVALR